MFYIQNLVYYIEHFRKLGVTIMGNKQYIVPAVEKAIQILKYLKKKVQVDVQ